MVVLEQEMAVQNQPNACENDEFHNLGDFQRNNPPTFKGMYDPDGSQTWLKEIERIFCEIDYSETRKVRFGTHMLAEEADIWWINVRQVLETSGKMITWVVFCREFMRKYFLEYVREKKEIEYLELKQGSSSVTEYVVKFMELVKFYPHYSKATADFPKCIKFKNGLRLEIKQAIGYQQTRKFP
ncbi:uncharacterized protein LOC131621390 [Vicia villosa]|uniref:uncharacterized protein LOC131621390 n=1 Tax=Vicia villosa TaxID=3911 RepID=UPI00273C66FC|nr:uncharacterized protein LOC131621390 [Vicia villosa]